MSQVNSMAVSALTQKSIKEGTTPEAQESCWDAAQLWEPGLGYSHTSVTCMANPQHVQRLTCKAAFWDPKKSLASN